MHAAQPMDAFAGLVAIEAGAALYLGGGPVRAAETDIRRRAWRRLLGMLHVGAAGAMASLAPGLRGHAVTRAMNRKNRFFFAFVVATRADRIATGPRLEDFGRVGCICAAGDKRRIQHQGKDAREPGNQKT